MRNQPLASRTTTSCSRQTRENSAFISNIHTVSAGLDRQALDHHASQHCENRFHRVQYYNCTNKYKWNQMNDHALFGISHISHISHISQISLSLHRGAAIFCYTNLRWSSRGSGSRPWVRPLYGHRNMEKTWRKLEMDIDGANFTCNVWLVWWRKWFQPIGVGKSLFFRQMYTVLQGKASLITHKIKRMV